MLLPDGRTPTIYTALGVNPREKHYVGKRRETGSGEKMKNFPAVIFPFYRLTRFFVFYSEEGLMVMRIKGSENCRRALLGQPVRNLVNGTV